MGRVFPLLALMLVGSTAFGQEAPPEEPPAPFVVIVHPSNPLTTASADFVTDVFLKRTTRWPGGGVIEPVDLGPGSPVRRRFTEAVLDRSVASVRSYWQRIIFTGRGLPPLEVASDAAVVSFVLANPAAIGYVAGTTDIGAARVLVLR